MKKKDRSVSYLLIKSESEPTFLEDAAAPFNPSALLSPVKPLSEMVSVRTAKANLSALLDMVANGARVMITSDGRPKARLVPLEEPKARKLFEGSAAHLQTMPAWQGGMDSTEMISADRDGR